MINSHKSMLLQTLPFFGNSWCNNSHLVSRFMKGVFNSAPPKPKYRFIWNPATVLNYVGELAPNDVLNLKVLTLKVIALVALAAAPRAQTLTSMNLEYMRIEDHQVVFLFPMLLKTSRPNKSNNFVLKLKHFHDEKVCVMHNLLYYISVTKKLRKSSQLFISYVTHKPVTSSTIARWLKCVLDLSGIDTSAFSAHSFRSAAVSSALDKGCSIKDIITTADWSSDSTFFKFYYRNNLNSDSISFANAVFSIE